ncbi:hypothetical protein QBC38DRAFT_460226 [Podospora fimiseda]|uniref:Uncharacterized protein n=1 Tax=Podospora fimiseda TaxID=252190 RepID=A0AAN6YRJ4_9PEZI|nr:hypothetical protein QBC38DRAFT_460226 [Podospora fimiseda]
MASHGSHSGSSSSRRKGHRSHRHGQHNEAKKLVLWFCHMCNQDNNWETTLRCINPQCQHPRCGYCEVEHHDIRPEANYAQDPYQYQQYEYRY